MQANTDYQCADVQACWEVTSDYFISMTYICYHHKIIPENYFALTVDGQLIYNGRCVDSPRPPHIELVECMQHSGSWWEMKRQGPVWGSLRLHQTKPHRKEWCIQQVRLAVISVLLERTLAAESVDSLCPELALECMNGVKQ